MEIKHILGMRELIKFVRYRELKECFIAALAQGGIIPYSLYK